MFDFVCQMPGLDSATATWHGMLHVGLSALIAGGGSIFLLLGAVSYRRSPAAGRSKPASIASGTARVR